MNSFSSNTGTVLFGSISLFLAVAVDKQSMHDRNVDMPNKKTGSTKDSALRFPSFSFLILGAPLCVTCLFLN